MPPDTINSVGNFRLCNWDILSPKVAAYHHSGDNWIHIAKIAILIDVSYMFLK